MPFFTLAKNLSFEVLGLFLLAFPFGHILRQTNSSWFSASKTLFGTFCLLAELTHLSKKKDIGVSCIDQLCLNLWRDCLTDCLHNLFNLIFSSSFSNFMSEDGKNTEPLPEWRCRPWGESPWYPEGNALNQPHKNLILKWTNFKKLKQNRLCKTKVDLIPTSKIDKLDKKLLVVHLKSSFHWSKTLGPLVLCKPLREEK